MTTTLENVLTAHGETLKDGILEGLEPVIAAMGQQPPPTTLRPEASGGEVSWPKTANCWTRKAGAYQPER